jgi:hypothetical protein
MRFEKWFRREDHDFVNFADEAMKASWEEAVKHTAKRCRVISHQRLLSKNPGVDIEAKIKSEFNL